MMNKLLAYLIPVLMIAAAVPLAVQASAGGKAFANSALAAAATTQKKGRRKSGKARGRSVTAPRRQQVRRGQRARSVNRSRNPGRQQSRRVITRRVERKTVRPTNRRREVRVARAVRPQVRRRSVRRVSVDRYLIERDRRTRIRTRNNRLWQRRAVPVRRVRRDRIRPIRYKDRWVSYRYPDALIDVGFVDPAYPVYPVYRDRVRYVRYRQPARAVFVSDARYRPVANDGFVFSIGSGRSGFLFSFGNYDPYAFVPYDYYPSAYPVYAPARQQFVYAGPSYGAYDYPAPVYAESSSFRVDIAGTPVSFTRTTVARYPSPTYAAVDPYGVYPVGYGYDPWYEGERFAIDPYGRFGRPYADYEVAYYQPAYYGGASYSRVFFYDDPYRSDSFYDRHRNLINIGLASGAGAAIGAILDGKKGALIGAGIGAGAGALYTYGINPKDDRL